MICLTIPHQAPKPAENDINPAKGDDIDVAQNDPLDVSSLILICQHKVIVGKDTMNFEF